MSEWVNTRRFGREGVSLRPIVGAGASSVSVTGYALVKSLAPAVNFFNISGPLLSDVSGEETRLYIAVAGAVSKLGSTPVTSVLAALSFDSVVGQIDTSAILKSGSIITSFDPTTMTWATQPDLTDATQMVGGSVASATCPTILRYDSGHTFTPTMGPFDCGTFVAPNGGTNSIIKGFVFVFQPGVSGRVTISNVSGINFYNTVLDA